MSAGSFPVHYKVQIIATPIASPNAKGVGESSLAPTTPNLKPDLKPGSSGSDNPGVADLSRSSPDPRRFWATIAPLTGSGNGKSLRRKEEVIDADC
jgi:hypothetical protein